MRRDEHGDLLPLTDGAAQKLQLHAGRLSKGSVLRRDGGDARHQDAGGVDVFAEHHVGQDADLASGVDAVDVGSGVLLGVAAGLRVLERGVVALAELQHLREDEVRRAVENAADLEDLVRAEALAQRVQHRDAAADGGLKQEAHAVGLGQRQQLRAVLGDELFVGGDDVLADLQRAADEIQRRAAAADGLNDQKDLGVGLHNGKVLYHLVVEGRVRHVAQIDDIGQLQRFARILFQYRCVPQQDLGAAAADGTGAQDRDLLHSGSPYSSLFAS